MYQTPIKVPYYDISELTKVKEMGSLAQLPINLCGICSF